MSVVEKIGVSALLEQTAEECCELAHACLKMARKLRDENPTPRQIEDIRDELVEEMADVELCLIELDKAGIIDCDEVLSVCEYKEKRWHDRLDLHMDLGEKRELELDDVVYSD